MTSAEQQWTTAYLAALAAPGDPLPFMPQPETFRGETVRQPVRLRRGGGRLRLVLSNEFGAAPLVLDEVTVSVARDVPPRPVRLDQLITTKNVLDLHTVLAKDSTFYGDLFPHVIRWKGELYLEDGLHRALRAAMHQRSVLHARVLDLD